MASRASAPESPAPNFTATSVGAKELEQAIQRGIAILVSKQENYDGLAESDARPRRAKNGEVPAPAPKAAPKDDAPAREWPYEGVYRVQRQVEGQRTITEIPIGYRVGGTSIVASALIEAQAGKLSADSAAAVGRALEFVLEGIEHPLMTKEFVEGYDVRGWGHAYGLEFLLIARARGLVPAKEKERVDAAIRGLVLMLQETEIENGGWNYSRSNGSRAADARRPRRVKAKDGSEQVFASPPSTFMTAPTLQFLFEAARQGEAVDASVIERGLASLENARLETGAFQYGTAPERMNGKGFEDVPGAIGRMPVCETTLFLAGRGSVERVRKSIAAFFEHWEWLEKRRKQTGTHIEPYMIAPYYFFYAHRYVAQGIEFLPEKERAAYREKLYTLLWKVREESGGWNDRVFPRSESFGTAMTLLALHEPVAKRPAGWSGGAKQGSK